MLTKTGLSDTAEPSLLPENFDLEDGVPTTATPRTSMCAELLDAALYPVVYASSLLGSDRVVVSRLRTEAINPHPKTRIGMAVVDVDRVFCRLAKIIRIRAVMHDSVMHICAPRIVGCPTDNRQLAS